MEETVTVRNKLFSFNASFEDPPLKIHKIYKFLDFVIDSKME